MRDLAEIVQADEELLRTLQAESHRSGRNGEPGNAQAGTLAGLLPLSRLRRRVRQGSTGARLLQGAGELSFGVLEQARGLAETGTVGQQMALPGNVRLSVGYETAEIAAADSPSPHTWPQLPNGELRTTVSVPGQWL